MVPPSVTNKPVCMDRTISNQDKQVQRHHAQRAGHGRIVTCVVRLPGRCCRCIAKADPTCDFFDDEGEDEQVDPKLVWP